MLREERSGLLTRQKTLTIEGFEINRRISALEQSISVTCPLCEQPLSDNHRLKMLAALMEERDFKREEFRQATLRIMEIADAISSKLH